MNDHDAQIVQAVESAKALHHRLGELAHKLEKECRGSALSLSIILAAAERQIPYTPAEVWTGSSRKAYECRCKMRITDKTMKFCSECGQKLDFRESQTAGGV